MYKEPKNFEDILKLQAVLDANINSVRERTLEDIRLSMIAEIIEFNEETKESHKTWKSKEYNRNNELEELTDIWFFYAQMCNYLFELNDNLNDDDYKSLVIDKVFLNFDCDGGMVELLYRSTSKLCSVLIGAVLGCDVIRIMDYLKSINKVLGYTKEDILKTYWAKWQKNMDRIGKEWN